MLRDAETHGEAYYDRFSDEQASRNHSTTGAVGKSFKTNGRRSRKRQQPSGRLLSRSVRFNSFVSLFFVVSAKEERCFAHLNREDVDESMFRSVLCLLQRLRLLPTRMCSDSKERVVMGDMYRYHKVMRASWNAFSNL